MEKAIPNQQSPFQKQARKPGVMNDTLSDKTIATLNSAGQRNHLMDNIRGFAILTVVLGHSIQYCMGSGFWDQALFQVIYAFHMPLFFFISGYVHGYSSDLSLRKYAERTAALVLPFVVWGLFDSVVFMRHPLSALEMLAYGRPVWFLWALFLMTSLLFIVRRLVPSQWVVPVMILCWAASYTVSDVKLLGLTSLWIQLPYLIVGYGCQRLGTAVWSCGSLNRWFGWGCVALFTAAMGSSIAPELWGDWSSGAMHDHFAWKSMVAFLGIGSSFWILSRPSLASLVERLGSRYGRITLEIYVIHIYPVLLVNRIGEWMDVPLGWRIAAAFVIAVGSSVALIRQLRRYTWLQGALFGKTAGLIEIKEKLCKRKNH